MAGAGAFASYSGVFGKSSASRPSTAPASAASPHALTALTSRGTVTVEIVAPGVARLRIAGTDAAPSLHSYAVEQDLPAMAAELVSSGGIQSLSTPEITVGVDSTSGAITASTPAGVFLTEAGRGFESKRSGYSWQLALPKSESCHGLGQRAFPLSLRDRRLALWNYDARSYEPGSDPLYLSVPFYLGHRPDLSYGIFWDNPSKASLDLDSDNNGLLTYECEQGAVDIYLISGDGPQQVVQRFAQLTGLMELPPLWAIGYHQSRWGYRDEGDFRAVAARMRAERIPCDALHFDIDYMDQYRVFTWDRIRFADPKRLLSDLRKDGFQAVAILDPGIKADSGYSVYKEGRRKGLFLTAASGKRLAGEAWAGKSEFPDFTNPECRSWWSSHVRDFAGAGFSGLWNDMNEPSTFVDSRTLPEDTPHDWEGEGNTHVGGGHAVYGMQMARASRDGLASLHPDRRPFIISRAGYAGLQRFASTWNGDSLSTWGHLQMTIPQLLNLGMSAIPFSGSDAGGFRGDPDAELYIRWMQLASMTPFFRTHSARTSKERSPWSFGPLATDRIREIVELRYRLLPYLYTAVQQACTEGVPVARPMFFERPDAVQYQQIDDQFMLGDSLLVAPILVQGSRSRTVVLPPGTWFRIDEAATVEGDSTITDGAGMGLPIYVRGGSVLPTWPVRESTSRPVESLILDVYPGTGNSRLYEDAGDGYGYRDGENRISTFGTDLTASRLIVTWAKEGRYAVPYTKVQVRVLGLPAAPSGVVADGRRLTGARSGGVFSVNTGHFDRLELTL